jgi:O-antigen ligase
LWGSGYGSAPELFGLTAHNSYLLCLVELGFIGFLLWIGMLLVVMVPVWRLSAAPIIDEELSAAPIGDEELSAAPISGEENARTMRSWARAVRNALVVFMVTSFFLSRTYHSLFLTLIGIGFALIQIDSSRANREAERLPIRSWMPMASAAAALSVAIPYAVIRLERFLR